MICNLILSSAHIHTFTTTQTHAFSHPDIEITHKGLTHNPWLIHVNVWQKPLQYYKVISLQLIKINGKKKSHTQCKYISILHFTSITVTFFPSLSASPHPFPFFFSLSWILLALKLDSFLYGPVSQVCSILPRSLRGYPYLWTSGGRERWRNSGISFTETLSSEQASHLHAHHCHHHQQQQEQQQQYLTILSECLLSAGPCPGTWAMSKPIELIHRNEMPKPLIRAKWKVQTIILKKLSRGVTPEGWEVREDFLQKGSWKTGRNQVSRKEWEVLGKHRCLINFVGWINDRTIHVKGKERTKCGTFMRSQKERKKTGRDLSKYCTFPIILSLDPHNTLEGLVGWGLCTCFKE